MFMLPFGIGVHVCTIRNDQYFAWTGSASTITWVPHSIHGKLLCVSHLHKSINGSRSKFNAG